MFFDRSKLFGSGDDEPDDDPELVVGIPMKWYASPVEFTVDSYELEYGYGAPVIYLALHGTTEYGEEMTYECDGREAEVLVEQIKAYREEVSR